MTPVDARSLWTEELGATYTVRPWEMQDLRPSELAAMSAGMARRARAREELT